MELNILSQEPKIIAYDNFLDLNICESLTNLKDSIFQNSEIRSGEKGYRTSKTAVLEKSSSENKKIEEIFLDKLKIDIDLLENFQIQKYKKGEEYKEHFDGQIINTEKKLKEEDKNIPRRKTSFIIYLNSNFEGGETFFPSINIKIIPKTGTLLMFSNMLGDSNFTHPLSSHLSKRIRKGKKFILTSWSSKDFLENY